MYDYEQIEVERRGRLLVLTLNNPPMNTMSRTLHREMASVFYEVQGDPGCDVAIVTGSGHTFSAGGDIPLMQSRIDDPELMTPKNAEMKRIISSLLELEKPLICRMNGDAVGFGATLALFCDITVAVDTARIGDPHVKMGYVTGDGSALIWPQLVGYARAKEYLLTGDLLDAKRAVEIGLINYAVPADRLDEKVDYFANKLVNGAARAIRWSKTCINIPLRQAAPAIIDAAIAYQTITNVSHDHQEAVNAFREKRRPKFKGS
ncbi:MAG TPA: enoyl-CoA hydratase/isomerase family protein [Burkholderiales bacterium]|nr:enoyl-CoA hydratase/isomerase family protein [Burkholderiales bacterium]